MTVLGSCRLWNKGTGASRNAVFGRVRAAWLGASPLFPQLPIRRTDAVGRRRFLSVPRIMDPGPAPAKSMSARRRQVLAALALLTLCAIFHGPAVAGSPLKKGTGTSRNAVFDSLKAAWLGASPLFQRASRPAPRGRTCHVTRPPAWTAGRGDYAPRPFLSTRRHVAECRPAIMLHGRSLWKKGTGSEPSGLHATENSVPRGACPLFQ